jgi:hypothetical protein
MAVGALRIECDPEMLGLHTTSDTERLAGLVGQERALEAMCLPRGRSVEGPDGMGELIRRWKWS